MLLDSPVEDLSAAGLLAAAEQRRAVADRAEADLLVLAAAWADLHPPESVADAAVFIVPGSEREEPVAGPGCPAVAEFCLGELGAVLGMSTMAAKRLVGQALELRHRLPRLWRRVQAGEVPAWRARRVAEATIHACPELSVDAVGWVDVQIAPFAERTGVAQLDRTVQEALRRFGPESLPEDPEDPNPPRPDSRHLRIDQQQVSWSGTLHLAGELDLADALDLDHALSVGAAELKALGCCDGLEARRAVALGHLARHQLSLDLAGAGGIGTGAAPDASKVASSEPAVPVARELVLHVHLRAAATAGDGPARKSDLVLEDPGRLEEGQRLILLEQVRSWCAGSHTKVTVTPVLDLNREITTGRYVPTTAQREHVVLRDGTCVFPWCARPARRCDIDHVVAFDHDADAQGREQPGPTSTANLVALCRRHHRLKTHGRWRAEMPTPGTVIWTSPHGHRFLTDGSGTTHLTRAEPPGADRRRRRR